ncbi:histidine kinase family protein [Asticcacaulis biprosthecium C19]|uniref:Histidine kinase family protein n=2 Tax=Asticcacaulis biprosthecium TaxID=76891 RepID=F4QGE3_9CAUL|nr:histidine kinase family protein [Asticcacaulis biprosthecium C19]
MALELIGTTVNRFEQERDRASLLAALSDRERRLEFVVGRLFSAQEEERRRLSHDLHDGVAQTATALARLLEGASGKTCDPLQSDERLRLASIARDLVGELRSIIAGLRPTLLDDLGLQAAITSIADILASDRYEVDLQIDAPTPGLPSHVETALYRVAQEATNNIRKHAGGPCRVLIHLVEDRGAYCLRVRDFGQGIKDKRGLGDMERLGHHVGIQVMQERMIAIGGSLEWQGSEGGVTVTASLGASYDQ